MSDAYTVAEKILPRYHDPAAVRHRLWRHIKDVVTEKCMAVGGISVIIAIVLIFFYLLYIVLPLFKPATMERVAEYPPPGDETSETLYVAIEEHNEIGLAITSDARAVFFRTNDGTLMPHQGRGHREVHGRWRHQRHHRDCPDFLLFALYRPAVIQACHDGAGRRVSSARR